MAVNIVRQVVTHNGVVYLDPKTCRQYRIYSGLAGPVVLSVSISDGTFDPHRMNIEIRVDGGNVKIPDNVVNEPAGCAARTFRIENASTIDVAIVEKAPGVCVSYTISVLC